MKDCPKNQEQRPFLKRDGFQIAASLHVRIRCCFSKMVLKGITSRGGPIGSHMQAGRVDLEIVVWLFPHFKDFGGRFGNSFSACTFIFFFLDWVEINSHKLIPIFMPGLVHSGSVCLDCGRVFPEELHVSSFPWQVPTLCLDSRVSMLGQGCMHA